MPVLTVLRNSVGPSDPGSGLRATDRRDAPPHARSSASTRYRASDGRTLIGFSTLVLGALALGFVFTGTITGNEVVPILITSGIGLLAAAAWYAAVGQYSYSLVFVAFAGFNGTYAFLQLGVTNNWYGIPIQDLTNVVSVYVAIWLMIFVLITLAVLASSAWLLSLIMIAGNASLGFVLAANLIGSITLLHWASAAAFLDALLGTASVVGIIRGWRKRAQLHRQ